MAVQHFAFTKFKAGLTDAEKTKYFEDVRQLLSGISDVKKAVVGPPVNPASTQGYDFALALEFEDINAFKRYLPHPDHKKILKKSKDFMAGSILTYQIDTSVKTKL